MTQTSAFIAFSKSGVKKYLSPIEAPGRLIPLTTRKSSIMMGNEAVIYAALPVDLIPLKTQKKTKRRSAQQRGRE